MNRELPFLPAALEPFIASGALIAPRLGFCENRTTLGRERTVDKRWEAAGWDGFGEKAAFLI